LFRRWRTPVVGRYGVGLGLQDTAVYEPEGVVGHRYGQET